MELQFKTVPAKRCPKKDVIAALEIYCKSVDHGSLTDTNQIKDYIWNTKQHANEERIMFFYLLYGQNNDVLGFSEFAYLPENKVLVLDYLCTHQRNHLLFYNFYHLVLQDITDTLKKEYLFIRYIITELSLNQYAGKLIDTDSNYFRHLLSNENFQLLKYPYYQPPLLKHETAQEFNIAIKLHASEESMLSLRKAEFLSIVEELYFSHYDKWYQNYLTDDTYSKTLQQLIARINSEILNDESTESIALVKCQLFEDGQCPKFQADNITISRNKRKTWKTKVIPFIWVILSIVTFAFCVFPAFSNISTILCSFLTIIAGIISIVSLWKEF
ncbi:MAG: hypothetical protein IKK66_10215 [Ruminococcus sp.]|nr:hypothetical protein [Ruminococcus sp.]